MAENKVRRLRPSGQAGIYIDGNTIRKEETVREVPGESREQVSYRVRKNREKAMHMTLPYVLLLTVATVAAVVLCYQMLQLQSRTLTIKRSIQTMQASIDELRLVNDGMEDSMLLDTDLDYVYKVATKKLGMVYPTEEQIIRFDKTESEYVRQYEDIPIAD